MRKHVTAASSTEFAARDRKHRQALLRGRRLASQKLAFGPVQFQGEGELMPALPRVVRQQRRASDEIA